MKKVYVITILVFVISSSFGQLVQKNRNTTSDSVGNQLYNYRVLHHFTDGNSDGSQPMGSLVQSGSTLYGMTGWGGSQNNGVVFKINPDGCGFQVIHNFVSAADDGQNPYVTNTICRGNPFYPMLGSKAYPSLSAMGQDPIELYETPHNMMGKNRFIRLAYAIFGRPGAQPYFPGQNAVLMLPFDIGWKDFSIYYFHDVRISGFGPLFSGALILGIFLLSIILFHKGTPRLFILLFCATIVLSLLISTHTWWARYGPQLWWFPIVAIIAGFTFTNSRVVFWCTRILVVILLINAILIAVVHFRWEVEAARKTNEQLSLLKQSGDVEIEFNYFREPFSERLLRAGVTFHAARHFQCTDPIELMSVSPGYPGAVRACRK